MSDLELQCRLATRGAGRVLMRIDDGLDGLELQITRPDDVLEVMHNDQTLATAVQLKTLPGDGRYSGKSHVCSLRPASDRADQRRP